MNNLKYIIFCGAIVFLMSSCSDFLDVTPKGALSDEQLTTPETVEKMVIAAYTLVETDWDVVTWLFSDLRSGDAYKGGGGVGDMAWAHRVETALTLRVNEGDVNAKWIRIYFAISRANNALARINNLDASVYPDKAVRAAEMRFLRAHQMFELKRIFKHIVWVDETIPAEEYINISNRDLSDMELWDKIIEDFRFAVDNIPEDNVDVGRANKFSAKAYLAKTLMYAAYEQDEQHNVININKEKLEEAIRLIDDLSTRYSLSGDFAENFLWEFENGQESIFAVQSSHDDSTPYGHLNMYAFLAAPMSSEYGCCGLHLPSQNLVNAYKTDPATGLPLFDTYNKVGEDIVDAHGVNVNTVDPRLLHTVGILGLPYKYRPGYNVDHTFLRDAATYGPFISMKEVVIYDCPCFRKMGNFYTSSLNRDILRYDDMLLLKAEALIELGRHKDALPVINQIRSRAANSTSFLIDEDGKPSGNFKISLYEDGINCAWDQDYARKALRLERRLELAMESSRGFDLVRWGIAAETMNEYFQAEQLRREYLKEARFTKNRDEYFPIPYQQISFSKRLYKQNYGWPEQ
ncbi:MAG: RagB/SusD family nutrient uptake outer membrane protein [Tannerellaceae bacterium]|jgi:hypothetical protein|nr:RagB/SusD family nutrient uptake outer membrane protein [Tannerellaceae bacterium]